MKEGENEAYLGDIIGNTVSENDTFNKALIGIEKLGQTWLRENIGIYGKINSHKHITNTKNIT